MTSQRTVFTVNNQPFIAIAGEAHNSSASTAEYMEMVWKKAKEQGLNTVLIPAYWELIEPEEGIFDFTLIDELITQARIADLHLIFLWFGTWKNAQCMYAPEWVKKNLVRFPRAQVEKGKNKLRLTAFHGMPYTTLSYLGEETKQADATAFACFMSHLKDIDEEIGTVIGVQVENEVGLQGSDREHSDEADALFESPVPEDFIRYMKSHTSSMEACVKEAVETGADSGTWAEVFGDYAGEIFSAYHIASFVEYVASSGKAIYNLPMSVNCWLDKGQPAGVYPSGGPVAKVMEVWRYVAPSIDVFSPDIYVQNFTEICDIYTKLDNPLFIPETATHSHAAPRLVYTIGHYHAACFAPFGFEDMGEPFDDVSAYLFGVDTTDPLLKQPQNVAEYRWCAEALNQMMPLLTKHYGTSDLQAVISEKLDLTAPFDPSQATQMSADDTMIFGDFGFKVIMNLPTITRQDGVCLIVKDSPDTYYILANGCMLAPFSTVADKPNYDIIALEEGTFTNGEWYMTRRLNGDEAQRLSYNDYTLLKLKVFTYA